MFRVRLSFIACFLACAMSLSATTCFGQSRATYQRYMQQQQKQQQEIMLAQQKAMAQAIAQEQAIEKQKAEKRAQAAKALREKEDKRKQDLIAKRKSDATDTATVTSAKK